MSSKPPTAVKPEMALVTDMRGLCRAGDTPHTVWYPHTLASPNLVTMELNTAPGEATPSAMMAPRPPVVTKALFRVGLYKSTGPAGSSFFVSFLGGCGAVCSRSFCVVSRQVLGAGLHRTDCLLMPCLPHRCTGSSHTLASDSVSSAWAAVHQIDAQHQACQPAAHFTLLQAAISRGSHHDHQEVQTFQDRTLLASCCSHCPWP